MRKLIYMSIALSVWIYFGQEEFRIFEPFLRRQSRAIMEGFIGDFFTSAFLFIASALSLIVFVLSNQVDRLKQTQHNKNGIWLLLSFGFFMGSLGEIFDLHNIFFAWKSLQILADIIPMVLALLTGIFIIYMSAYLKKEGHSQKFLFIGVCLQAFSSIDTKDRFFPTEIGELVAAQLYLVFVIMAMKNYYTYLCSKIKTSNN